MPPGSHEDDPVSCLVGTPIISIIIPVYNTSAYLETCLQSLIDQEETRFEIIAVDDGSTDDSWQILEAIALRHTRLRIYSKENGGQGSARNMGLAKARGKYIMFVDSDDTVATDLLSRVVPYFSDPNLDVVSFGIEFRDETSRVLAKRVPSSCFHSMGSSIFIDAMLDRNFLTSVCNKIYRRSLLDENSIKFPELRAYEDSVFSRHVALHARKVYYLKESLYFALVRTGSTSRGMTESSFIHAADMIAAERELFGIDVATFTLQATFRAHIARFFAYIIIQAAFRIDDPTERAACFKIANTAGFSESANDKEALALLDGRMKLQVLLARNPAFLRIMAVIARRFNFVPY